jgi:DNA-binding transcriptional MerR regulator/methylmalonyl-CoA mutase cobalamin-binding subunit
MSSPKLTYSISQVERDTGLTKDVLRVWERRYEFPRPGRDEHGERVYDVKDVERLRVIKRLMDAGHRPGKLLSRPLKDLRALASKQSTMNLTTESAEPFDEFMALISAHDAQGLERCLGQSLLRLGLRGFVLSTLAPLNIRVGEAWLSGAIAVHEEHFYTEHVQNVLRGAIRQLTPRGDGPRVLLTTLPQELHGLGLLMVEALLVAEDAACVSLGTQTPVDDILVAAVAHRADIVALSFSSAFPLRVAATAVETLRRKLDPATVLWVGGRMVMRLRTVPAGVDRIVSLETISAAVTAWRQTHRPVPPNPVR